MEENTPLIIRATITLTNIDIDYFICSMYIYSYSFECTCMYLRCSGSSRVVPENFPIYSCISGPGCSKLTTSLVNVSLQFQMLHVQSEIRYYSLLKNMQCKRFCHFFNKKFQCIWF